MKAWLSIPAALAIVESALAALAVLLASAIGSKPPSALQYMMFLSPSILTFLLAISALSAARHDKVGLSLALSCSALLVIPGVLIFLNARVA